MLSVLEAMISQYGFLDEHTCRCVKITVIGRQQRERNSRLWRLNQKFYSPRKTYSELHCKLLVALAIVSVTILSPEIERFSIECRKVIGFAITTLRDWLKRFAPLFHPIRSKTKTYCDALACIFPRFASATCNYFKC